MVALNTLTLLVKYSVYMVKGRGSSVRERSINLDSGPYCFIKDMVPITKTELLLSLLTSLWLSFRLFCSSRILARSPSLSILTLSLSSSDDFKRSSMLEQRSFRTRICSKRKELLCDISCNSAICRYLRRMKVSG